MQRNNKILRVPLEGGLFGRLFFGLEYDSGANNIRAFATKIMKKRFTFLSIILSVVLIAAMAQASSPVLYREPYSGQQIFSCGDAVHSIPQWYERGNVPSGMFLQSHSLQCNILSISLDLSYDKNCNGANVCVEGKYSSSPASYDLIEVLGRLTSEASEVQLPESRGYFIPSTCAAYCNNGILFWIRGERVYTLELKSATERELPKLRSLAEELILRQIAAEKGE